MFRRSTVHRGNRHREQRPTFEALEGRQLMSLGGTVRTNQFNESSGGLWFRQRQLGQRLVGGRLDIRGHPHAATTSSRSGSTALVIRSARSSLSAPAPTTKNTRAWRWTTKATSSWAGSRLSQTATRTSSPTSSVPRATRSAASSRSPSARSQQTDAHVAMDAAGDFVVAYTRYTNNNNYDIFAKLYNVNERLVDVVPVAATAAPRPIRASR